MNTIKSILAAIYVTAAFAAGCIAGHFEGQSSVYEKTIQATMGTLPMQPVKGK